RFPLPAPRWRDQGAVFPPSIPELPYKYPSANQKWPVFHKMVAILGDGEVYQTSDDKRYRPGDGHELTPRESSTLAAQREKVAGENADVKQHDHGDREQHHVENVRGGR